VVEAAAAAAAAEAPASSAAQPTAKCNGVQPSWSCWLTTAPCCSRFVTHTFDSEPASAARKMLLLVVVEVEVEVVVVVGGWWR